MGSREDSLAEINADRESRRNEPFFSPLPSTLRLLDIRAALQVLSDPDIPQEHAKNNHNCGECWECISGTVTLMSIFRKERTKDDT